MNATTVDVQQAAEDIVAAIEAATDARRTDECCRADAMLQIYGIGDSAAAASGESTGSGPGTPVTSSEVGSPGTLDDGSDCECEEVEGSEVVTNNGWTQTLSFTYNSCVGFDEVIVWNNPLTGNNVSSQVTRPAFCTPSTVLVGGDCECEEYTVEYEVYAGDGSVTTETIVSDSCTGVTGVVTPLLYGASQTVGYCSTDFTNTAVYTLPDLTAALHPGTCPPPYGGQELFTGPNGEQFYQAIASSIPTIPIGCPAPESSDDEDCEPPCNIFGDPLLNGDGSPICCEAKDGQTILEQYKNLNGDPVFYSNDPTNFPGAWIFDNVTGVYNRDPYGFHPAAEAPLNGPGDPGLAPVSTGFGGMFGAYVYACEPEVDNSDPDNGIFGIFQKAEVDCGDPQTLTESYTNQWCQYLKCQASYQNWMTGVLGVQVVASLFQAVQAQKCLNEILSDQKTISAIKVDDVEDMRACSAGLIGQQDGLLKQCQQSLMADFANRLGITNSTTATICEAGDDIWDCFAQVYKPANELAVPGLYDALSNIISSGDMTTKDTANWAQVLDGTFMDCFLPEMKREFNCILDSANHSAVNINQWRDSKRDQAVALNDHYKTIYQCGENTLIPSIMHMSECMITKVCELRDYLKECGEQDICDWNDHYRRGEMAHAESSFGLGQQGFGRVASSLQWLDENIHAFKDLAKGYETGEVQLSGEIHRQSNTLAPEICKAYQEFQHQRIEYSEFWKNCWKDPQCRLVRRELELACRLADCIEDSIERMVQYAREGKKNYKEWYQTAEQHTAPKVIWAGNDAVDALEDMSCLFEEQTEKFRDVWECKILPCDMLDLEKHCDLWCHVNPLLEINEVNHDLHELQIRAQDGFEKSVQEAICILDEIGEDEEFDYCVEEQALLHVRAQFDKAEEELIRCNSRYCGGFMAEGLVRLKTERAKAEGGAFEAANRWKWWANEQIRRRRFEQQAQLLQVMSGYASHAINAGQAVVAGNETLLASNNRTLNRVYTYLQEINNAGARVESINAQLMANMQQMITTGHFWPSFSVSTDAQANQTKLGIMSAAQSVMEQGNFFLERETWATLNGSNFLKDMLSLGNNVTDMGHYWTEKAVQANAQRSSEGRAAVQVGQQAVSAGHELQSMGTAKISGALQSSLQAAAPGISTVEIGQRYSAKSLDSQAECIDSALEHLTLAGALIDSGIQVMSEIRQSYNNANVQGAYAQGNLISLISESRQQAAQSLAFREECFSQTQDMIWKTKELMQNNLRFAQAAIHGNDLASINQLSDQVQSSLNSSLSDVFAGLTALGGNLTTAPVPYSLPNIGSI